MPAVHSGRSYRERVEHSIEVVLAATAVAGVVLLLAPVGRMEVLDQEAQLSLVAAFALLVGAVRLGLGPAHWLDVALLACAPLALAGTGRTAVAGFTLALVLALVALCGGPRWVPLPMLGLAAGYLGYDRLVSGRWSAAVLEQAVVAVLVGIATLALVVAVRSAGDVADAQVRAFRRRAVLAQVRSRQQAAAVEARRVVHDHILGALRMIVDSAPADADQVRAACARAVAAAAEAAAPAPEPTTGRIRAEALAGLVGTGPPAGPPVTVGVTGADHLLPAEVATAITLAARQALENVARHAAATQCHVQVTVDPARVEITIADNGRGLVPGYREGFGLTHSVRGRLRSISGTVEVESRPGRGTTVLLSAPIGGPSVQGTPASTYSATMLAVGGERRGLLIGLATVMVAPVLGYLRSTLLTDPTLLGIPLLVCHVVLVTLLLLVLARRSLGRLELVGVGVVLTTMVAASMSVVGTGDPNTAATWPVGAAGLILAGLAALLPLRWVIGLMTPLLVVVALDADLRTVAAAVAAAATLNAVVTPPLLGHLLGRTLRSVSDSARAEAVAAVELAAGHIAAEQEVAEDRLRFARMVAVPWLRGVVDGTVDLTTARSRAELMCVEVRDDLYLPQVLDEALRRRIRALRDRGATITIQVPAADPVDPRPTTRFLDRILDLVGPAQTVIVELPTIDHPRAQVSVRPPVADDAGRLRELLARYDGQLTESAVQTEVEFASWAAPVEVG